MPRREICWYPISTRRGTRRRRCGRLLRETCGVNLRFLDNIDTRLFSISSPTMPESVDVPSIMTLLVKDCDPAIFEVHALPPTLGVTANAKAIMSRPPSTVRGRSVISWAVMLVPTSVCNSSTGVPLTWTVSVTAPTCNTALTCSVCCVCTITPTRSSALNRPCGS